MKLNAEYSPTSFTKAIIVSALLSSFIFLSVVAFAGSRKLIANGTNGAPFGFYEYLPSGYASTGSGFPVILYLHGAGEFGNGTTELYKMKQRGLPKIIEAGRELPFIVLAPQSRSWWDYNNPEVFLDWLETHYNIDPARIYVSGISVGATETWKMGISRADEVAAILPLGGKPLEDLSYCMLNTTPVWTIHGEIDNIYNAKFSKAAIDAVNNCTPAPSPAARYTGYANVGHDDLWDYVYSGSKGDDVYSWLLSHKLNPNNTTETNSPPTANAGSDKSIHLPTNYVKLYGSGQDTDGSINSYYWQKISGPSASISGIANPTLSVSQMAEGTYIFSLKVTDNEGASNSDQVTVTVKPSTDTNNDNPVAYAGNNQTLTLPTNSITLYGSGSDNDGTISSYSWKKSAGATATLSGTTSKTLNISNLVEGLYSFTLTVTDNLGASHADNVQVTVLPAKQEGDANYTGTKVLVNFNRFYPESDPSWNNTNATTETGKFWDLKDFDGLESGIKLTLLSNWGNEAGSGGHNTFGMASGIYPEMVTKNAYWTSKIQGERIKLSGLKSTGSYTLTFFGSRNGGGDRTTLYTVEGKTVSLNAAYNTNKTVSITGLQAPTSGELEIKIQRGANSSYGYLNALVITYAEGTNARTEQYTDPNTHVTENSSALSSTRNFLMLEQSKPYKLYAIEAVDVAGRTYTLSAISNASVSKLINIADLPSGLYVLNFTTDTRGLERIKFFKNE